MFRLLIEFKSKEKIYNKHVMQPLKAMSKATEASLYLKLHKIFAYSDSHQSLAPCTYPSTHT